MVRSGSGWHEASSSAQLQGVDNGVVAAHRVTFRPGSFELRSVGVPRSDAAPYRGTDVSRHASASGCRARSAGPVRRAVVGSTPRLADSDAAGHQKPTEHPPQSSPRQSIRERFRSDPRSSCGVHRGTSRKPVVKGVVGRLRAGGSRQLALKHRKHRSRIPICVERLDLAVAIHLNDIDAVECD
jgi:hypothetical protein